MKKQILFMLISKWKTFDSSFKRKLLIGAGLVSVVVVFLGIFSVYLMFKAGGFLIQQAQHLNLNNLPQTSVSALAETEVNKIPALSHVGSCSSTLLGLASPGPWLEVPLAQTFAKIKAACLAPLLNNQSCPEGNCKQDKEETGADGGVSI